MRLLYDAHQQQRLDDLQWALTVQRSQKAAVIRDRDLFCRYAGFVTEMYTSLALASEGSEATGSEAGCDGGVSSGGGGGSKVVGLASAAARSAKLRRVMSLESMELYTSWQSAGTSPAEQQGAAAAAGQQQGAARAAAAARRRSLMSLTDDADAGLGGGEAAAAAASISGGDGAVAEEADGNSAAAAASSSAAAVSPFSLADDAAAVRALPWTGPSGKFDSRGALMRAVEAVRQSGARERQLSKMVELFDDANVTLEQYRLQVSRGGCVWKLLGVITD
jgi:hypothetical protein